MYQLAGIIVILDDIDVTALLWITLHDRKLAVPEFFDFLGLAVEIIIMDLADQISVQVNPDKVGVSVEIPIAFNLDHFVVLVGFDNIRPTISVCVDCDLVGVLVDPVYPLVGASVATTVRDCAIGFSTAVDEAKSQHCQENCGFPHVFL